MPRRPAHSKRFASSVAALRARQRNGFARKPGMFLVVQDEHAREQLDFVAEYPERERPGQKRGVYEDALAEGDGVGYRSRLAERERGGEWIGGLVDGRIIVNCIMSEGMPDGTSVKRCDLLLLLYQTSNYPWNASPKHMVE